MEQVTNPQLGWRVIFNRASPPGVRGWGRVRAAQLGEMRRVLHVAAGGQTVNALLLAYAVQDAVPSLVLAAWLVALATMLAVATLHQRQWQDRAPHSVSKRAIERAGYFSIALGFVWIVPAYLFFPIVELEHQLAICIVTAGMMAGAAFVFSSVPPAAGGYVLVMGGAATTMLLSANVKVWAIGPAYTIGLLFMVFANGRAFMQRRCAEIALEERSETISLLLREYETSDADWLWETNRNLCFQNVSARFARALDCEPEALRSRSIVGLVRAMDLSAASEDNRAALIDLLERRAPFTDKLVPIAGPDGTRFIQLSARPRFDRSKRFIGYRGVGSDVTESEMAARRIAYMARHDSLTGLPNRLQLTEALGRALRHASEGGGRCAILLIDLDRFKAVNDTLGHVAGDHLLQQVSARFQPLLAAGMTAGRLGGDEFAIVIPAYDDIVGLEQLCYDLIEVLKQPFTYHDQHLFVGASIGLAVGPADGATVDELVRSADLALYRAKEDGGNEVCFYEASLHARAEKRRRIELALRGALDAGEFSLVFQPVADAASTRIRGFEALMRWTSAELGSVAPSHFIPLAEETGLIRRIGEWVLRNACAEAATWPGTIGVAVNVSPLQLSDPGFMLTLVSALSQSGLAPERLELEITETVFLQITPLTNKVLNQIQSLGVRLAIDDFGTGYSSLGYLRDSNFDTIKIDRSFVQAARPDEAGSDAIIRAVVALAGSLGMATVAEGVETPEQLAMIRALGCDRIQGYIFSPPVPGASVHEMLAAEARRAA